MSSIPEKVCALGFYATSLDSCLHELHGAFFHADSERPIRLTIDHKEVALEGDPLRIMTRCDLHAMLTYKGLVRYLSIDRPGLVKVGVDDLITTISELRGRLRLVESFEMLSSVRMYPEWSQKHLRRKYRNASHSFGGSHFLHGWVCAFKGDGHRNVVSRRWLTHGPWRLLRDEEADVSLIQFHDTETDPETALEQAIPGYQRMGISKTGGYMPDDYPYQYEWDGLYVPDEKKLRIVVMGREVEQLEMLEACALRRDQKLGEDKPLENVAYVFMLEEEARAHLHELWLRELECWAIIDGEEVRLDDNYQPEVKKPQWVLDVEAREAAQS